jgi:mannose-1-phosphate guanylyltransferase
MNPAIEQIVSSDEAARATVERAERDAAKLINVVLAQVHIDLPVFQFGYVAGS